MVRPKEQSSSSPASAPQASQRTKPPGTLRHAEPEPRRARRESSSVESCKPAAAHAATVNAAKAEAEEANPVPAGKLLCEMTLALVLMQARARTRSRCATTRSRAEAVASASSIVTLSASRSERNSTVVVVVKRRQVHRKRRVSRQTQGLVAIAPVLDEGDVRMCDSCSFLGLHQTCPDVVLLRTALYRKMLVLDRPRYNKNGAELVRRLCSIGYQREVKLLSQ